MATIDQDSTEPTPEIPPYRQHVGPTRQYIRDIILGVNDGLVSIFLLVVGLVGGGLETRAIVLAGVAAAVAGGISMSAGEYIATAPAKSPACASALPAAARLNVRSRPHLRRRSSICSPPTSAVLCICGFDWSAAELVGFL